MIANPDHLRSRFINSEITHAVVIDDAFDDRQAVSNVQDVDGFWAEIEANQWQTALESKGVSCLNREDFESEGLPALWNARREFTGAIESGLQRVFIRALENLQVPEAVVNHLERLGVSTLIKTNGKGAIEEQIPSDSKLVFLDYDLEGDRDPSTNPESRRSVAIAKALSERRNRAPFLILFSSMGNAAENADEFRNSTGYLRGTFAFIAKSEAASLEGLCQRLSDSCVGNAHLGHLQHFFFTLKSGLKEVAEIVEKEVMQLDVQDYAFIQRLALQEEGTPLGEYMLNLFSAVLSHELCNDAQVQEARRALDKLDFGKRHLPFCEQPSMPIQRIYRAVLTDPGIGVATPHPQVENGTIKDGNGNAIVAPPLLMLGDIFVRDPGHQVFVVMNAPCDLQYSPSMRTPDLEMSVFLMAGILEPLERARSKFPGKRMEFLEIEKKTWRVLWQQNKVKAIPLGEFDKWQSENVYRRIARLSLPHSLALQQMWTSQLNRIGLPVNLPFVDICDIQVCYLDDDGKWQPLGEKCNRSIILGRHPRDSKEVCFFTLTIEGRDFLHNHLQAAALKLDSYPIRKEAANRLLESAEFWCDLVEIPRKIALQEREVEAGTPGLVFVWIKIPQHPGLTPITEQVEAKMTVQERTKAPLYEKAALTIILSPS